MHTVIPAVFRFACNALKDYDGSHDIHHAINVAKNVTCIHKQDGDLQKLAIIAALLHDTCDKKYVDKEKALSDIKGFLTNHLPSDDVDDILSAIQHISFSSLRINGPPQLNSRSMQIWRIVSEADMLEAIGVTGFIRTLMYQGHKENNLEDARAYMSEQLVPHCNVFIQEKNVREEARLRTLSMKHLVHSMDRDRSFENVARCIMLEGSQKSKFMNVVKQYVMGNDWVEREYLREFAFSHK